jgi:flagellar hook protein FlgE
MGYEYNLKFSIKPVTSEQSSYKDATTTEFLFNFPDEFDLKDTSTYKFYRTATIDANATPPTVTGVNDEITATGLPSDLLDALKKEAQSIVDTGDVTDSNVITAKGTHATGTNDYVAITIDNGFLTKYNITDLGPASSLMNSDIGIEFSGDTMYEAFDSTGKSMGTVDIPATELAKLYTAETDATSGDPTGNYILDPTNTNATAPSIIMTRKTYTDGTPTSNTFALTDGTAVDLNYSDVSALLSLLGDGEMQSSYTVNEPTTLNETRDGYYTISLREMTDSNGDQVDISALGSTEVQVYYDISDGSFQYVGSDGNSSFTLNLSVLNNAAGNFSDVEFDMSNTSNVNNDGKSTVEGIRDDGYKVGNMTGVSIGQDGTITASYDNGMQKNIAQISVATFENAMGLENVGDNLYTTTANSGDFNGIGVDIKGSGTGYMTTGVLEMSNVDLSTEFTNMITTQRGFQANSRIITTSDTLLEELVNLKR